MKKKPSAFLVLAAFVLPLLLTPWAAAQGVTVGPTCTLSWSLPTTNVDGTPLTAPITETRIYVMNTATPPTLMGAAAPTTGGPWRVLAPATTFNCAQFTVETTAAPQAPLTGVRNVWVTAFNGVESALSTTSTTVPPVAAVPLQFSFVATKPSAPSGLKVGP